MSARERLQRKLDWATNRSPDASDVMVSVDDLRDLLDEPADIGGTYDPDDIHIPSQGKFVGHQLMRIVSHTERQQSLDLSDYYEPTDDDELAAARRQGFQDAIDLLRRDEPDCAADIIMNHWRRDIGYCDCGWNELGKRHSRHVAGLIADYLAAALTEGKDSA